MATQAQQRPLQESVFNAFAKLSEEERRVLSDEMSLTGVAGQAYTRGGGGFGPVFLVKYSPAFLRKGMPVLFLDFFSSALPLNSSPWAFVIAFITLWNHIASYRCHILDQQDLVF